MLRTSFTDRIFPNCAPVLFSLNWLNSMSIPGTCCHAAIDMLSVTPVTSGQLCSQ